ncbi:MAG: murein biosynthesis integral membrane protein MurJ [candidate division WOR-3 bacterium]
MQFSVATFISRILGFIRDASVAFLVGAGRFADVFNVAFRIPNLLRDLLAENVMQSAFVPTYVKATERDETPKHFLDVVFTIFLMASLFIVILGIVFSKQVVLITAYGFRSIPEKFKMTVEVTRITFPYLTLVSLASIFQAILNARKEFFQPALSTAYLNLGVIFVVVLAYFFVPRGMYPQVLGFSVLFGGLVQLLYLIQRLKVHNVVPQFTIRLRHPYLKDFGKLLVPVFLSVGFSKITPFVNTLIASFLREGAVSYLTYAYRLMQLPVGLFAVALQTVSISTFAELDAKHIDLRETLWKAVFYSIFLTLPSSIFIILYSGEIVKLLFERGAFTPFDTILTAQALIMYTPHVVAIGVSKIFLNYFFAKGETKFPNFSVVLGTVANLCVAIFLSRTLDFPALALAVSTGTIIQMIFLMIVIRNRAPVTKEYASKIFMVILNTFFATLPCLFIKVKGDILRLVIGFFMFTAVFISLSILTGAFPEFKLKR